MSTHKKPSPVFVVAFEGSGIYPERIPLGTLTDTLSAVRRLAGGAEMSEPEEECEEGEEQTAHDDSIRLLDVVRGSAVFRFVGPSADSAVTHLRTAGKVLNAPEHIGENDYVLKPVDRLSATARRLGCSIVIRQAAKDSPVLAQIGPTSYDLIAKSVFITGDTAVSGSVQRVGGSTEMRCALRVPFQRRLLFCKVQTAEVARKLGEYMYQDVVARGTARWVKTTWRLVAFTVKSVYQPEQGSLSDALNAIRNAGGHAWDKIGDPSVYLEEVNGKGPPA
jgi:hypothetical protein